MASRGDRAPSLEGAKWLARDYEATSAELPTNKQRKDLENQQAIGGLRSQYLSGSPP